MENTAEIRDQKDSVWLALYVNGRDTGERGLSMQYLKDIAMTKFNVLEKNITVKLGSR